MTQATQHETTPTAYNIYPHPNGRACCEFVYDRRRESRPAHLHKAAEDEPGDHVCVEMIVEIHAGDALQQGQYAGGHDDCRPKDPVTLR